MVQGELFREESSVDSLNRFGFVKKRSFLSQHQLSLSLDKLFVILIAVMVVFVLTYSFGVEHGKRAMEKRLESLFPGHSETVATIHQADPVESGTSKETILLVNNEAEKSAPELVAGQSVQTFSEPTTISPPVNMTKQGKYTVQLVTYMDQRLAEREVARLKSKGHEGFVIPSGRYFQVCVDYFENFLKAKDLLKQLRENGRYPDAYVRPVVR